MSAYVGNSKNLQDLEDLKKRKRGLGRPVWGVRGTHPQRISSCEIGVWNTGSHDVGLIQRIKAPPRSTCMPEPKLFFGISSQETGVPHLQENAPPLDPTVGLCLGSCRGPRGVGVFLWARYPCTLTTRCTKSPPRLAFRKSAYRGTSLIRNTLPVGPYSDPMPRDLSRSKGGGCFL